MTSHPGPAAPTPPPAKASREEKLYRRIFTLPNFISFARLVVLLPLAAYLLYFEHWWWGLGTLVVLGWTDWLDGFLARRLHQRTLLGARLDPVADRISVVVVCIVLAVRDVVPWWSLIAIAAVDLVLLCLAAALFRGSPDLPVSMIGKWRTAFLFFALPTLIVAAGAHSDWLRTVGLVLLVIGVAGHIVAGAGYAVAMVRKARTQGAPVTA